MMPHVSAHVGLESTELAPVQDTPRHSTTAAHQPITYHTTLVHLASSQSASRQRCHVVAPQRHTRHQYVTP